MYTHDVMNLPAVTVRISTYNQINMKKYFIYKLEVSHMGFAF